MPMKSQLDKRWKTNLKLMENARNMNHDKRGTKY